jgi:phosphatidylinositol kinase/protein kinase (PI-3  family)
VKATDALAGELWEKKKERIRRASKWSSNPDWDLRSMIVKSGDDCRQEHLAVQLVAHFYGKFSWCLGSSN